jgi:hypothetical protein
MVASIVQAPAGSVTSNASLRASFPTLVPLTHNSYDLSRSAYWDGRTNLMVQAFASVMVQSRA